LCIEDFPTEVRATGECSACGTWGVRCLVASHPRSSAPSAGKYTF
jgi:hypothetical protein